MKGKARLGRQSQRAGISGTTDADDGASVMAENRSNRSCPDSFSFVEMIAVGTVAVVMYVNTTHSAFQFVYDDLVAIQNNPDVRQQSSIEAVFRNDFWGTELCSSQSHKR